ncbi:hypothetical protein ACTHPH_19875 [Paenibacillus pasadenensis]
MAAKQLRVDPLLLDVGVYLAGYAAECSYKAILEYYMNVSTAKAFQHNLSEMSLKGLKRLKMLMPHTESMSLPSLDSNAVLYRHHPERRYAANYLWEQEEAREAIESASLLVESTLFEMILDGKIERKELGLS